MGIGNKPAANGFDHKEPLVWTVGEGPQKIITYSDEKLEKATQVEDGGLIEQILNMCLKESGAGKVIRPDDAEFASATPEAHRKGEKAYHVKAFRGSKDGKRPVVSQFTYHAKGG